MKRIIGLMLIVTFLSGCVSTRVNINTNVPGARVTVDGELLGQTPINSAKISNKTGRGWVIVEKEGYETYQGVLRKEIKAGATAAVVIGYSFSFLLLPLFLLLYVQYVEGPLKNQYIILEEVKSPQPVFHPNVVNINTFSSF